MKKFGFGGMRFPLTDKDNPKSIDLAQVEQMVDCFLENGFTYFDTAFPYHNGLSEEAFRETLVKRHARERFVLADKMPIFMIKKREEYEQTFQTQLERCGVEYFDYYLLHNLGKRTFAESEELGGFAFLRELKKQGRAKHIGFSFHDEAILLDEILTKHPEVDFVQLQLNYLDWNSASIQSGKCYETARKHNKPVIVMEPVKGGMLANLPPKAAALLHEYDPDMTGASLALRYAASLEGVMMVLSGMSDLEQMKENVVTMKEIRKPDKEEKELMQKIVQSVQESIAIPCTGCQYCVEDCPKQINIPNLFATYNTFELSGNMMASQLYYDRSIFGRGKASDCIGCKQCENHCPQHIPITSHLKKIGELFEKNPSGR
ncbi:MAG: aldo/keto reductase [Anaerofustis sp.]